MSSSQLMKFTSASCITAYSLVKMCLGSRVVDGPCLVDRRGFLGMRENRGSPIYAGLRLLCHSVFGLCWLLSIVFLLVSGSGVVD